MSPNSTPNRAGRRAGLHGQTLSAGPRLVRGVHPLSKAVLDLKARIRADEATLATVQTVSGVFSDRAAARVERHRDQLVAEVEAMLYPVPRARDRGVPRARFAARLATLSPAYLAGSVSGPRRNVRRVAARSWRTDVEWIGQDDPTLLPPPPNSRWNRNLGKWEPNPRRLNSSIPPFELGSIR